MHPSSDKGREVVNSAFITSSVILPTKASKTRSTKGGRISLLSFRFSTKRNRSRNFINSSGQRSGG